MVILEKDLRAFVKRCFVQNKPKYKSLFGVEAGKGGSEGFADLIWTYKKQMIPVELKIFRDGFFLRPSQYRFHRACALMKVPSFVVGVIPSLEMDDAKEISKNKLIIINGAFVDEFRKMKKKDFYNIDNQKTKNKHWVLENDFGDDHIFRGYFHDMLELMIDRSFERYE